MAFDPGAGAVKCPYCGHENPIPRGVEEVRELDFHAYLDRARGEAPSVQVVTVRCSSCGAETTLDPNVTSDRCPFCGSAIVAQPHADAAIVPKALLPFAVTRQRAVESFHRWLRGLWFAPGELKREARAERGSIQGVYVPHWTFDAHTVSAYQGERGDDYYETESYPAHVNGKPVRRTRQVRRTRWRSVSGVVLLPFDDVLVLASRSLPPKHAARLEPWDLGNLVPYEESYLSGFRTERYQVGLEEGFEQARAVMDDQIRGAVRADIGGDHQRIHAVRTQHDNLTFKHILLPVWISAYRYGGKPYRFLVNARTGEVGGERPWSVAKIAGAVLGALAVAAILAWLVLSTGG
jgi:DNA-directed RNA polymerase subunit RPC12/RpoP